LDFYKHIVQKLAGEVNAKEVSPQQIGEDVARRCAAVHEKCNAFIKFDPELIEKGIKDISQKIAQNKKLPLAGVSFGLSDAICAGGTTTTCASRMLESYRPPFEASVVLKLKEWGAFPAGKTNMDEFNLGATGKNSFFGEIKNPWDTEYTAGSGAAAAVSSRAVNFALAPDGCGELRHSASYCGIPALKPTYGRVSRKGLVDVAPSLDQIGIMAPSVLDLAAILEAISGYDPEDPTSFAHEVPSYTLLLQEKENIGPFKVAVPENWAEAPYLEEGIKKAFLETLEYLKKENFQVQMVSLPNFSHSIVTAAIIRAVEAFSSLGNYDGVRFGLRVEGSHLQEMYRKSRTEGFGSNLKQFLTFGALISAGNYYGRVFQKAQKMRTLIIKELESCLQSFDLLFIPAVPFQAPLLSSNDKACLLPDPAGYYTAAANLAGLPAITIPVPAESVSGSAGVQFIGKAFDEAKLLQAGLLLEKENPPRFPNV